MTVSAIREEAPAVRRRSGCLFCRPGAQAAPCSKRCRILYLLDHWEDIFSPPLSSGGGGGGGPALLPGMSRHHSVVELVRCLAVLKAERPLWHDHLKAYHCAEWRIHVRLGSVRRKGGKRETVQLRDRVRCRPQWVQMGYVRSGEFRLEELFVGSAGLPEEFEDAVTLSASEIEAKAARKRRLKDAA